MGLDFIESEEPQDTAKPLCSKCTTELKPNNEYSCQDDKRVCGDCWTKYLEHVRKFFT